MSHRTAFSLLAVAMVVIAAACAGRGYVSVPPPEVRMETPPPQPPGSVVWIPGYWAWDKTQYVWVEGRWDHQKPGKAWMPGHWRQKGDRWKWVPGKWK